MFTHVAAEIVLWHLPPWTLLAVATAWGIPS